MKIKAIIGLGNVGKQYFKTRHNIGFRIIDELANQFFGNWNKKELMEHCTIQMNPENENPYIDAEIILIKPLTYMNSSGKVMPFLTKQGIKTEEILVIHDELEKQFGYIGIKLGGSAKGHNGLRSIMEHCGEKFWRLKFGIGRPEERSEVGNFVLSNFSPQEELSLTDLIPKAISNILTHKYVI